MSGIFAKFIIAIIGSWFFYYVFCRFSVIFDLCTNKVILLCVAFFLSLFCTFTILYRLDSKTIAIIWTFSSWIYVLWFILFILLLFEQIISIWFKLNPWIVLSLILIILWFWILFSLKTKVTYLEIQSDKIEKDTKILLVSDIHSDYIFSKYHIDTIQNYIREYDVDFVLIAWDMLNKPNLDYVYNYSSFKSEKYPPIFAVIWNHDVMWNKNIIEKIQDISGIKLLNNESIELNWIQIVWVIDKSIWWKKTLDDVLYETNMNTWDTMFTIFATHQPIAMEKLENYPIDLEVAWHTHRGQFLGLRKIVEMLNDYWYWKYEYNWKTAFVTQGIWTRWLPFRLGTQSEIVIIDLKKN